MKGILHLSLTGHRPNKLAGYNINKPFYKKLQEDLEIFISLQLKSFDIVICHSGLALGADTVWSKAIISMREKYPDRVKFYAEVPMISQPSVWFKREDIDFWHKQMQLADKQNIYGSLEGLTEEMKKFKTIELLDKRNRGMIDQSDILLAVWNGSKGGTHNAVHYAQKKGIKIYTIKPESYFTK